MKLNPRTLSTAICAIILALAIVALLCGGCEPLMGDQWHPARDPYLWQIAHEEADKLGAQPDWRCIGIDWWTGGSQVQAVGRWQIISIDDRIRGNKLQTEREVRHELEHVLGLIPDWASTNRKGRRETG